MVNVFSILTPLLHVLMSLAGVRRQTVEIEPGTAMNFWVPNETIKTNKDHSQKKQKLNKPVVVLVHGFAVDGILTWFFQVLALTGKYAVYVPDLLFFGGSVTTSAERSSAFQAECLAKGLRKLGVERCTLVGFSLGGMVGFKMAKFYPDLVESMVVSGSVVEFTQSVSDALLKNIGFSRWSDYLMPDSAEGVKVLLSIASHKLPWLPDFFFRDFLQVMFSNRKERAELLEALVISDKDSTIPKYTQRIHLLWGENDKIFNLEVAHNLKERLGRETTLQYIEKAGHLSPLERPCMYNRHLKKILASLMADGEQ
ncbi:hypothetical protein F0562_028576 [Nyssa sinensis]|uniref:AB hydrolase-1 domain-containing protein n=1 Tax=Nyssa sinensis TaxID=561372 RepID=A0A5J5B0L5_9ASTE|nr:hypothetical protein F0562_028576 [Nyssa sinensis]